MCVKPRSIHCSQTLFLRAAKSKYQLQMLNKSMTLNKGDFSPSLSSTYLSSLQEPRLALQQQCYQGDEWRTVVLGYPSGDTAATQLKGIYLTMERSRTRNGFQRHRPLIFAKQLESPCLAAEQRVWLMKRCQNDNLYYQKTGDRSFFYCLGKLGGGAKSKKRIREQKGNKEKVLKGENGNYIHISIYIKNTTSPLPTFFNVSLVE